MVYLLESTSLSYSNGIIKHAVTSMRRAYCITICFWFCLLLHIDDGSGAPTLLADFSQSNVLCGFGCVGLRVCVCSTRNIRQLHFAWLHPCSFVACCFVTAYFLLPTSRYPLTRLDLRFHSISFYDILFLFLFYTRAAFPLHTATSADN